MKLYKFSGLFIALIAPLLLSFLRLSFSANPIINAVSKECCFWALFAMLIIIANYIDKEPIVFYNKSFTAIKTIAISIAVMVSLILTGMIFRIITKFVLHIQHNDEVMVNRLMHYPLWLKLLTTIRAGVIEETFFRAYAITRIKQFTNNTFLSFIIPSLFFAVAHYSYGTIDHVIGAFLLGIVLSMYYLKTKNLLSNIVGHTLYDFLALVSVPI